MANSRKSNIWENGRCDGNSGDGKLRELKIRVSVVQFRPWAPSFLFQNQNTAKSSSKASWPAAATFEGGDLKDDV